MTEEEKIRMRPGITKKFSKKMLCPHCDRMLPVDAITECDKCGAHLEVYVKTTAPPYKHKDI